MPPGWDVQPRESKVSATLVLDKERNKSIHFRKWELSSWWMALGEYYTPFFVGWMFSSQTNFVLSHFRWGSCSKLWQLLRTGRDNTCLRQVSVALPEAAISVLKEVSIQLKAEISNSERSENGCIQQGSHYGVLFSYPLKLIKKEINVVCWIHLSKSSRDAGSPIVFPRRPCSTPPPLFPWQVIILAFIC